MRSEPNLRVERYRNNTSPLGPSASGANWGCFAIPKVGRVIHVISSGTPDPGEAPWEHVSVSVERLGQRSGMPTWSDMVMVKELFWRDDETVVQFHPKRESYVNFHPGVLHLWKRVGEEYELPPESLIGPKGITASLDGGKP